MRGERKMPEIQGLEITEDEAELAREMGLEEYISDEVTSSDEG